MISVMDMESVYQEGIAHERFFGDNTPMKDYPEAPVKALFAIASAADALERASLETQPGSQGFIDKLHALFEAVADCPGTDAYSTGPKGRRA